ncbi:MAG: hypothetical protein ABJC61_01040 [Acidobacteriota bacterium]
MRKLFVLALLLTASIAVASEPDSVALKIPGAPDSTVTAKALHTADTRDVVFAREGGESVTYKGVPLLALLESRGLDTKGMIAERRLAPAVVVGTGRDGYTVVFSLGELVRERAAPRVYVAGETASGALPEAQGPMRLVVPGEHARSAFGLSKIEVRLLAENKPSRKSG